MPLNSIRGGGAAIFRHLQSRIARVPVTVSHTRNIYLAANSRFANPIIKNNYAQGILSGKLINSFATARGRPRTREAKTANKTKKTKKTTTQKSTKDNKKRRTAKSVKPKKELTPERKERRRVRTEKLEIKELKKNILRPPKLRPTSTYVLAFMDSYPEAKLGQPGIKEAFAAAVAKAKSLLSDEKLKYDALSEKNAAANAVDYEGWCRSYTPLQIKEANAARRKLARLRNKRLPLIHDDRLVKRPRSSYLMFATERLRAGESITRCAEKWKALPEEEKQPFVQQHEEDVERYRREYKEVYGEEAPRRARSKRATA